MNLRKQSSPPPGNQFQRLLLAISAVALILSAFVIQQSGWFSGSSESLISGTLIKVGIVLGIAWLAAPQLERLGWQKLQGTALIAVVIVIILFAARPRLGAIAGALLAGGSLAFGAMKWIRQFSR